jgi:hypothetical protein
MGKQNGGMASGESGTTPLDLAQRFTEAFPHGCEEEYL